MPWQKLGGRLQTHPPSLCSRGQGGEEEPRNLSLNLERAWHQKFRQCSGNPGQQVTYTHTFPCASQLVGLVTFEVTLPLSCSSAPTCLCSVWPPWCQQEVNLYAHGSSICSVLDLQCALPMYLHHCAPWAPLWLGQSLGLSLTHRGHSLLLINIDPKPILKGRTRGQGRITPKTTRHIWTMMGILCLGLPLCCSIK